MENAVDECGNAKENEAAEGIAVCGQMDTSRYVVRRMTSNDIQQVQELHWQLFPVKYGPNFFKKLLENPEGNITNLVLVDTSPKKIEGCNEGIGECAKREKIVGVATCRVAVVEDSIIGFLLSRQEAYLMTFGISSEYRRKGLATMLLDRLKEVMAESEPWPQSMALHVQASNDAAISFYKRAGFKDVEFLTNYYHFDENIQLLPGQSSCRNAYVMKCSLKRGTENGYCCSGYLCFGDKIQSFLKKLL